MTLKAFTIEFYYNDIPYSGLVRPCLKDAEFCYCVILESKNQENHVEFILCPSNSPSDDWNFLCENGELAGQYYDKALLEEVGEQVEACLLEQQNYNDGLGSTAVIS